MCVPSWLSFTESVLHSYGRKLFSLGKINTTTVKMYAERTVTEITNVYWELDVRLIQTHFGHEILKVQLSRLSNIALYTLNLWRRAPVVNASD